MGVLFVVSAFPDAEVAGRIAKQLVEERLAACANITAPVRSIYRWQGQVEEGAETMVFFKTTTDRYEELQAKLRSFHPYDVPEIIALRAADGLPDYLRWVTESCTESSPPPSA